MKNTLYDGYQGRRINRTVAKKRVMSVLSKELTERQRQIVTGYYLEGKNIPQLAAELGVHKSTVSRTLIRGETRLRQFLKY